MPIPARWRKLNAQGVSRPDTVGGDERCELRLTREGAGVNVTSTPGCRYFLRHARRTGWAVPENRRRLQPAQLRRQRALFKQQYDRKDYAGAVATLAPLLSQCQRTLDWLGEPWLRNDLALAQLRAATPPPPAAPPSAAAADNRAQRRRPSATTTPQRRRRLKTATKPLRACVTESHAHQPQLCR